MTARSALAALTIGLASIATLGCDDDTSAERKMDRAGDKVERAADKVGDATKDAADRAGDKIEEAGDKAKRAAD